MVYMLRVRAVERWVEDREEGGARITYTTIDGATVADTLALKVVRALLPAALLSGTGAKGKESVGVRGGEGAGWGSNGEGEKGRGDSEDEGGAHLDWCLLLLVFGVQYVLV